MRFTTSIVALLASTAFAAPTTKRDANSAAVSSLQTTSTQMVSQLSSANTQLQTLSQSSNPPNGGSLNTIVQTIENNFAEGIALFQNIAKQPSTSSASTMGLSMESELTSLQADITSARSRLSALSTSNPVSVNGINNFLGTLVPGISDMFNEIVAILEGLNLPPL